MMIHDAFSMLAITFKCWNLARHAHYRRKGLNVTEALGCFKGRGDHRKAHMTFITFHIDCVLLIFNSLAALVKISLQDRVEFNEGDIGLTGGIQILEPANLNPITSESQPQGMWQNQTMSRDMTFKRLCVFSWLIVWDLMIIILMIQLNVRRTVELLAEISKGTTGEKEA